MNVDEINGRKSLAAWLEPRPQSDAIAIAHRCALRVFPIPAVALENAWAKRANFTALPILRCNLTSGASCKFPTSEIRRAAFEAADVVCDVGNAAPATLSGIFDAAYAAAFAGSDDAGASFSDALVVANTFGKEPDIRAEVRADARMIEAGQDLLFAPLWSNGPPDWFTQSDVLSRAIWAKEPAPWSFWLRWWDGVLSGHPLDWKLQEAVALIPDEVWKQGPERVAEAIADIELSFAVARTPNAEIIRLNPETGLFHAVADTRLPADHLTDVGLKISDAAETFGGLENSDNRYTAARPDIEYLKRRAIRDKDNPRALHDLCRSVARRLTARVKDQSLPADDPLVEDCIRQLNEAAIDIVGFDEKTREVVTNRAVVNLDALDLSQAPGLIAVADQTARLGEGVLVDDIPEHARLIMDPKANAEDRAVAAYSELSRFSRIIDWYRRLGTKEKLAVAGAGLVAAAGGINTLFELMGNLWPFVQWLFAALF